MAVNAVDAESQFPELFQVLAGYLHQDFALEFDSADAGLRAAAREWNDLDPALREIDALLAADLDDDAVTAIVEDLTAGYSPVLDGWEIRPWLEHARAILGGET